MSDTNKPDAIWCCGLEDFETWASDLGGRANRDAVGKEKLRKPQKMKEE